MSDLMLVQKADRIATLTINRPDKLNALSYALIDHLLAILDELESDPTVGVLILTGAGDRAFCAGADIGEFSRSVAMGPEVALRDFVTRGQRLTARVEAYTKPVVVAVNGLAYGAGCEITEAAPLAIASEAATFAKPEVKLGMPPTFGGTQRLPRLAGRKRALEHLLTGEPFPAQRALDLGLVNDVVPPEELLPAARSLAQRILRHSPLAIASILTAVTRGLDLGIAEGLLVESEQFARVAPTADLREGLDAWTARRAPSFSGSWFQTAKGRDDGAPADRVYGSET